MSNFTIEDIPSLKEPLAIEERSLAIIEKECEEYNLVRFPYEERQVIKRLIHASSCFENVIDNIYFTKSALDKTKELLQSGATIITDTNMIKSGISNLYTKKYNNKVVCLVNDDDIKQEALKQGITRSYLAVKKAIIENKNKPIILACGNAPTFLYSAIKTIVENDIDPAQLVVIAFPVGFVNVVDAKEYTKRFLVHYGADGIIIKGRFGSSTLVVSCLHAIYKLIKRD